MGSARAPEIGRSSAGGTTKSGNGRTPPRPSRRDGIPVSHPDDLLADYVDGTLDERARADVDAPARGAAVTRFGWPQPRGRARRAGGSAGAVRRHRTGAGGGGTSVRAPSRRHLGTLPVRRRASPAAALVVVVALNVGDRGSENTPSPRRPVRARPGDGRRGWRRDSIGPPSPFFGLEQQLDVNYDVEGIRAVASEAAGAAEAAVGAGGGPARERRRGLGATHRRCQGMRQAERAPKVPETSSSASSRPSSKGHPPTSPCSPRVPAQASPRPHRRVGRGDRRLPRPDQRFPEDPAGLTRAGLGEGSSNHS